MNCIIRNNIKYKLIQQPDIQQGRYYISSCGSVWDLTRDKESSQVLTGKPQYKYCSMAEGEKGKRKLKRVHRLLLETWDPEGNTSKKLVVDHIDRDKMNNRLSNLRWVTRSDNQRNTNRSLNKRITLSGVRYHLPDLGKEMSKINNHKISRNLGRLERLPKDVDYIDFELLELCLEEVLKPKPYIYQDKELASLSTSLKEYHHLVRIKKGWKKIEDDLKSSNLWYKGVKYISLEEIYNSNRDENSVSLKCFKDKVYSGKTYEEALKNQKISDEVIYEGKTLKELHEDAGVKWDFKITRDRYNIIKGNPQSTTITWDNIFTVPPRIRSYSYKGKTYSRLQLCKLFGLNANLVSNCVNYYYPLGQYMLDKGDIRGWGVSPVFKS